MEEIQKKPTENLIVIDVMLGYILIKNKNYNVFPQ